MLDGLDDVLGLYASGPREYSHVIRGIVHSVANVRGDFVECGVLDGDSLVHIASAGRKTYAVDSFEGLALPTEGDGPYCEHYRAGWFSRAGSTQRLENRLSKEGISNVVILKGFIPEVLPDIDLAFAHIDLDHYEPTKAALSWAWERLSLGGIILMHDWFPDQEYMASKAIREFLPGKPWAEGMGYALARKEG